MSDTESQASEYCTAPTSQNSSQPNQPSPGAAEDDNNTNNVTTEREKSDSFGLLDNLPGDLTLSKFLPAAIQSNMLSFITGKDSLEQNKQ